jgi:hypothetical protein
MAVASKRIGVQSITWAYTQIENNEMVYGCLCKSCSGKLDMGKKHIRFNLSLSVKLIGELASKMTKIGSACMKNYKIKYKKDNLIVAILSSLQARAQESIMCRKNTWLY